MFFVSFIIEDFNLLADFHFIFPFLVEVVHSIDDGVIHTLEIALIANGAVLESALFESL